jgi:hypothetical protein
VTAIEWSRIEQAEFDRDLAARADASASVGRTDGQVYVRVNLGGRTHPLIDIMSVSPDWRTATGDRRPPVATGLRASVSGSRALGPRRLIVPQRRRAD